MPPFRFRLQPLLDRRRHVEEEKQHRFDLQRRERDEAVRACAHLVTTLARLAMRPGDAGALAVLDAGVAAQQRRAANVETVLRAAHEELIVARRERRALEKLCERRRRAHEEEEARRDELEIEEANARRRAT